MRGSIDPLIINPPRHRSLIQIVARLSSRSSRYRLTDPVRLLKLCRRMQSFETLIPDDPVLAVAQVEARNLLHRAKENEENFASFLEGASQKLIAFNPAGHLGHYGSGANGACGAVQFLRRRD